MEGVHRTGSGWGRGGSQIAAGLAAAALIAAAIGACGSSDGGDDTSSSSSSGGSHPSAVCGSDPRAEPYVAGLTQAAKDGAMKIRLESADPAPPGKGNNTWTIQVLDGQGKPINGASLDTKAFMPDHGHGSSIKPQATPKGDDGTYTVTPVNLFMPGIWQITFEVTPPQGAADSVVFTFCIAG